MFPEVEFPADLRDQFEPGPSIGKGGMGTVFSTVHLATGQPAALKILDPAFARDEEIRDRFILEAKLASKVRNRHVAGVVESGQAPSGQLFIAYEKIEGETLRDVIKRESPMPWSRASLLVRALMKGLKAIHKEGIVHRDLKPTNLLLDRSGTLKIIDFGIARDLADEASRTQTGEILGTPSYLSPEQIQGDPVSVASDLYAAGTIIYEMLVGEPPFTNQPMYALFESHLNKEPVPADSRVKGLPRYVSPTIQKLLRKDPKARFQSATEVLDAISRKTLFTRGKLPISGRVATDSSVPIQKKWSRTTIAGVFISLTFLTAILSLGPMTFSQVLTGTSPKTSGVNKPDIHTLTNGQSPSAPSFASPPGRPPVRASLNVPTKARQIEILKILSKDPQKDTLSDSGILERALGDLESWLGHPPVEWQEFLHGNQPLWMSLHGIGPGLQRLDNSRRDRFVTQLMAIEHDNRSIPEYWILRSKAHQEAGSSQASWQCLIHGLWTIHRDSVAQPSSPIAQAILRDIRDLLTQPDPEGAEWIPQKSEKSPPTSSTASQGLTRSDRDLIQNLWILLIARTVQESSHDRRDICALARRLGLAGYPESARRLLTSGWPVSNPGVRDGSTPTPGHPLGVAFADSILDPPEFHQLPAGIGPLDETALRDDPCPLDDGKNSEPNSLGLISASHHEQIAIRAMREGRIEEAHLAWLRAIECISMLPQGPERDRVLAGHLVGLAKFLLDTSAPLARFAPRGLSVEAVSVPLERAAATLARSNLMDSTVAKAYRLLLLEQALLLGELGVARKMLPLINQFSDSGLTESDTVATILLSETHLILQFRELDSTLTGR